MDTIDIMQPQIDEFIHQFVIFGAIPDPAASIGTAPRAPGAPLTPAGWRIVQYYRNALPGHTAAVAAAAARVAHSGETYRSYHTVSPSGALESARTALAHCRLEAMLHLDMPEGV